jgi:hypothetical protein
MTTQDIYSLAQMGLQIVIGGGIVVGISRYFGILRRAIESQKATIEAQSEQIKAQSTVLQDFERLNKGMRQVIDTVDAPAMLQRMQSYKALVDTEADAVLKQQAKELGEKGEQAVEQVRRRYLTFLGGTMNFIATLLVYVSFDQREMIIETANLPPSIKTPLRRLAHDAPYILGTDILARLTAPPLEPQVLEEEDTP